MTTSTYYIKNNGYSRYFLTSDKYGTTCWQVDVKHNGRWKKYDQYYNLSDTVKHFKYLTIQNGGTI